jgi:hypothetical protein
LNASVVDAYSTVTTRAKQQPLSIFFAVREVSLLQAAHLA